MTGHPHVRRNLISLMGDYVFFAIGLAFFDPLIIVPSFTQALTGSEMMVGLLAALRVIVITLPQVWAASMLAAQTRKKPLLVASSLGGRLPVLLLAIAVYLAAADRPTLVLLVLGFAVIMFYTSEGLNSISWPDLVAKVLPAAIRGRFLGIGQLLSSIGALAAGYAVRRILASEALPYPNNWALIFVFAVVFLVGSAIWMLWIREEPGTSSSSKVDVRKHIGLLFQYLRQDAALKRIVTVQVLLFLGGAAFPFLALRAQTLIANGQGMLGTFIIAQNLGAMLAALTCGILVDRVGSWAAVRVGALAQCLALTLAVLAPLAPSAAVVYTVAFFLVGLVTGSGWWVFSAYLMDIADEDRRASYFAASGVLTSPSFIAALVIGAVFTAATAEAVFGVGLLFALSALGLSLTLAKFRAGRLVQ